MITARGAAANQVLKNNVLETSVISAPAMPAGIVISSPRPGGQGATTEIHVRKMTIAKMADACPVGRNIVPVINAIQVIAATAIVRPAQCLPGAHVVTENRVRLGIIARAARVYLVRKNSVLETNAMMGIAVGVIATPARKEMGPAVVTLMPVP